GNLKCLYIKNDRVKRSFVSMGVDCGSQYDCVPGLAHLLEHLLFITPESTDEVNEFDSYPSNTGASQMLLQAII
ncbi:hypothetical protein M153_26964000537, partial [Pseudoloma neurophilia]